MKRIIAILLASTLFASNLQAAPQSAKATKSAARISASQKRLNDQLAYAVGSGDLAKVKNLVARGAQVNAPTISGYSVLSLAAYKGNAPIVAFLASKGANPRSRDKEGFTPLIYAVKSGQANAVKAMLNGGAPPNASDDLGRTALTHSAFSRSLSGYINSYKSYLEGKKPTPDMTTGATMAKLLISRGANVNARDKGKATALMYAAMLGDAPLVRVLLNAGANPNLRNYVGGTALMMAVGEGAIMKILLANGANVNAKDKGGTTALMRAAEFGQGGNTNGKAALAVKLARILLDKGANPNGRRLDGETAYTLAEENHNLQKLLVARGAKKTKAPPLKNNGGFY